MKSDSVQIYPPMDVLDSIERFKKEHGRCQVAMLDPWYNKGFGGVREDYDDYIYNIIEKLSCISDHIYFWGFPEIVARFIARIPPNYQFTAWLTWFYKNNPSVIRGWRSSQNACIHMSTQSARLYPEHFLNDAQLAKLAAGKLRYMPGPTSVIEVPLNIGFIGKTEQTGHPSQKPMAVYERLIRMATKEGDMVFDPMCGSGTTGTVCRVLGRRAVISDLSAEYTEIAYARLNNFKHDEILSKALKGQLKVE